MIPNTFKHFFHYAFLYGMISYGGMALPNYMGGNNNFSLFMFVVSLLIIGSSHTHIRIKRQYFDFIIVLLISLLIVFATSTLSIGSIYTIVSMLIVVYAAYIYNPLYFVSRLLIILSTLGIISIILFTIQSAIGAHALGHIMPFTHQTIIDNDIKDFRSLYYTVSLLHHNRNCGPFGEPGQYQIVLCTALYFSLFKSWLYNEKLKIWYITIFFITLITTMSTSGYLALCILICCYSLHIKKQQRSKIDKKMKIIFTCILFISIAFLLFTDIGNQMFETAIYRKININETGLDIFSGGSGSARTISISNFINRLYIEPEILWGIGFDEMQKKEIVIDGAVGIINLLGAIGFISFSILFYFCCSQNIRYSKSKWESLCCIALFINAGLGQPHILNPLLFSMFLFSYFYKNTKFKSIKLKQEKNI